MRSENFNKENNREALEEIVKTKGYGYIKNGEPTDKQVELQDEIDNEIFQFLNNMKKIYTNAFNQNSKNVDWDIEKITNIRHKVEEVLDLPQIY